MLGDTELAALWRAAESEGYPFGPMVRLLMLTGCRRDEVRDAPWSEIDLQAGEWSIPGRRTKNGPRPVSRSVAQVAAILEKMPRIGGSRLLFTTTGETPISGLAKYKARLEKIVVNSSREPPMRGSFSRTAIAWATRGIGSGRRPLLFAGRV